jgi:L-lactate dehydrogenase complex protein LldG
MVEATPVNDRENMLTRVRAALRVPAPAPARRNAEQGAAGASAVVGPTARRQAPGSESMRRWLPKAGGTFEERLDLFRAKAAQFKADFHLLDTPAELNSRIAALREAEGWKRIASHRGELTTAACRAAGLPVLHTDSVYDVNELEACDAGITECDALIAQTGSVLVTGRSAGGRALSVLPPHHVVIAKREQLLPDLPAAFELLKQKYAPEYPSFISFITGPSRTGDIERILVLGVHGPKKLTILCV